VVAKVLGEEYFVGEEEEVEGWKRRRKCELSLRGEG
jgi:hypothetical protein